MSNTAIRVQDVDKIYRIGLQDNPDETLFSAILNGLTAPIRNFRRLRNLSQFKDKEAKDIFYALRDISFEVKTGDVVGIIGRNGAGKSTLLKILSRITEPSKGRIDFYGRVGSLLEVGTGFNPELTGRDNVYLNGTILGMRKAEIDRKIDEIIDFSGIENFMDTPVKRYSSGMRVRLAFAVAAHLEPEILIIDEVLAVGDIDFQRKCLGKMSEVAGHGRTVLFVSHNMAAVSNLCSRTIVLNKGRMVFDGGVKEGIKEYVAQNYAAEKGSEGSAEKKIGEITLHDPHFADISGNPIPAAISGEDLVWEFGYTFTDGLPHEGVKIRIVVMDDMERILFVCNSFQSGTEVLNMPAQGTARCTIPRFPLVPGTYSIGFTLQDAHQQIARDDRLAMLEVAEGDFFRTGRQMRNQQAQFLVDHSWIVK